MATEYSSSEIISSKNDLSKTEPNLIETGNHCQNNCTNHNHSHNNNQSNSTLNYTENCLDNCFVDSDMFNQFLQCCFDPMHLNAAGNNNNNNNNNNSNNSHCHNHLLSSSNSNHLTQIPSNKLYKKNTAITSNNNSNNNSNINNENDSSTTYDSESIKTNSEPGVISDFLNCCTPIDLNPCCATETHINLLQLNSNDTNTENFDENLLKNSNNDDLSEMITLNNFFSSCCNDSNLSLNESNKYSSLISPPLSTIKNGNSISEIYPTTLSNIDKVSKLRDSLKNDSNSSTNQNGHHHHLLHLHHHNPDDSSKSHTHDIIFHHHNANNCLHNNHANHHHHLHFEDQINGKKIKHDFILPDCDIKKKKYLKNNDNDNKSNNNDINSNNHILNNESILNINNDSNDPSICTDFLTSSICNLDNMFNNSDLKCKDIPQFFSNDYLNSNIRLPSQNSKNNTKSHLQHHHYLQHHYHHNTHSHLKNEELLHDEHFHTHNHWGHSLNNNGNKKVNNDSKSSVKIEENSDNEFKENNSTYPLICKWDDCNTTINYDDFDNHIFKNHLQYLPLSPGIYDENNTNYNNLKTSNHLLHCEWENCDFTTNDIDKFLEHVPNHQKFKNGKIINENSNDKNLDEENIHICQWIDSETGIECGKYFELTEDLTNHLITEHISSGKSNYVCCWKDCVREGKSFSQRQKIIRHLNTHTKHKPFECQICHKKFSLDLMLKQHMRIHTGEKPYKCDLCGKTFKTSSSLTIHLRIHSGDKPMACKICGKRFNESSNLNKHIKIHFRKYKCEHCLKSFETEKKFLRHQLMCKKKRH